MIVHSYFPSQWHNNSTNHRDPDGSPNSALTWLFLARLRQVGDAGMGAQEDVAGVQVALQEVLLGLTDVDATQGRLGGGVGWDQSQAVQPHLVDTVDGLRKTQTNNRHLERFKGST